MRHTLTRIEADPAGRPEIALVAMRGDVDAADATALLYLRCAVSGAAHVRIDLGTVDFVGAAFLGFLAALSRDAASRGATLHLDAVPDRVIELLVVVGMETLFDVVADDETARLRLRRRAQDSPLPDDDACARIDS